MEAAPMKRSWIQRIPAVWRRAAVAGWDVLSSGSVKEMISGHVRLDHLRKPDVAGLERVRFAGVAGWSGAHPGGAVVVLGEGLSPAETCRLLSELAPLLVEVLASTARTDLAGAAPAGGLDLVSARRASGGWCR
jgi:hypothetical protein